MHREQVTLPMTDGLETEDAKQVLRPILRAVREQRSRRERERAGESLAENALVAIDGADCVAAYVARPTEPSTYPLLEVLRQRGTRVLLPVLGPGLNREWALYQGPDDLEVRAPGRPPEPSGPVLPSESVAEADVVIAPALAVDAIGTRLGQGGGWYDRVLRLVPEGRPVFGMIFDEELISDMLLPVDQHDSPVPAVITPERWFLIEGSTFQQEAARRRATA
ncbi:5-formyltetrahydrofolate cyclo-ligase [Georgenia halophila]|uniref:5-formyltetrahydrofolate cyclo-ligase n=1 Tax=Georgenia halophila TaxID=620889 RepID=A0ABP8L488_9MICO